MRALLIVYTLLIVSLTISPLTAQVIQAPHIAASPINQRRAYGNGCGPASLLNAFQSGSDKWRKVFNAIPGKDSRTRIRYVVAKWGKVPSKHTKGQQRWNVQQGINLLDLTDIGNEMRSPYFLPTLKYDVMTQRPKESRSALLNRIHARFAKSFKKGLPPTISIRRYAYRYHPQVGQKSWWPIRAHFVVITEIPAKIPRDATSFTVKYIDPFGGFKRQGTIRTDTGAFSNCPFVQADFPTASVGKKFIKSGEKNILTLSAILGAW